MNNELSALIRAEWDRVVGWGLVAIGGVALLVGLVRIRDAFYVADHLSLLMSGGIGGLFCLGVGATLLITADIRDDWRRLDAVLSGLDRQSAALRGDVAAVDSAPAPGPARAPGRRAGRTLRAGTDGSAP